MHPSPFLSELLLTSSYVFLSFLPLCWLSLALQHPLGIIRHKKLDIFSPVFLVAGALIIGTTLRTCFLLFAQPDPDRVQRILGNQLPEQALLSGLVAINISIIMWVFGHFLANSVGISSQKIPERPYASRYYFALCFFSILALLLVGRYLDKIDFFLNLPTLGFSAKRFILVGSELTPSGHLRIASDLLSALTIIHALYYYAIDRRRANAILLIILLICAAFIPFIASARGEIIYLCFSVLVVRHYAYKKIKPITIFIVLALSVLLLGYMETLRQRSTSYSNADAIDFKGTQLISTMIYTPHFIGVGKTSTIIQKVPTDIDFLYGKSYAMTMFAPIPRVIWKDKPVVRVGRFVGQQIYERRNRSGVPPGYIGEAYLNFGWLGIIIISFILGWLSNLSYRLLVLKRHKSDIFRLGIYSILVISIIDILATDFTGTIMRFARQTLPFLFIMSLILTNARTGR